MEIEVKLYGQLRRYRPPDASGAPHHAFKFMLTAGSTAVTLAAQLGIPDGFVNAVAVNSQVADPDTVLQTGDQVSLFPPAAGGGPPQTEGARRRRRVGRLTIFPMPFRI